jgi:hypothetical protein
MSMTRRSKHLNDSAEHDVHDDKMYTDVDQHLTKSLNCSGLKQVVQCMIVSVKSIGNIMAVTVLLIFMFGVIGTDHVSP